ncbi:MAG: MarR family transcriptional regulator [Bacteroidetes bacterium]|nr:MarR family transcriptional regulator [Bacteroidota bacterium]
MTIDEKIKQTKFRNEYHRLIANLHFQGLRVIDATEEQLKPFAVSFQQFNLLSILRGQHPKSASATLLKDRMLDKNSDVSRLIERLRRKGLVERHTCPKDRRAVDVTITQQGLALLSSIDDLNCEMEKVVNPLTPDEARQLNELLNKLIS